MKNDKWSDFTNMVEWSAYVYGDDVAFDSDVAEVRHPGSFHRMFGDWDVGMFFSGNDGCWKWSAEKMANVRKGEYPRRVYDRIGMTFPEAMEECFGKLAEDRII